MRVANASDVHGNRHAFEAVIAAAEEADADVAVPHPAAHEAEAGASEAEALQAVVDHLVAETLEDCGGDGP